MSTDFVLFDFATKNLHLATIFLPLSRQMRLKDFVNFEPCNGRNISRNSVRDCEGKLTSTVPLPRVGSCHISV